MTTRLTREVPQRLLQSGRGDPDGEHLVGSRGRKLNPFKFLLIDCCFTTKSLTVAMHELHHHKCISCLWYSSHCAMLHGGASPAVPISGLGGGALAVPEHP